MDGLVSRLFWRNRLIDERVLTRDSVEAVSRVHSKTVRLNCELGIDCHAEAIDPDGDVIPLGKAVHLRYEGGALPTMTIRRATNV